MHDSGLRKTLGLTGVTMNAVALSAPGAFLWVTFQLQAAAGVAGTNAGQDIWTGVLLALGLALLTAMSFAELVRRYPEAGLGGSYYFAEKAFLDREEPRHQRFARIAKFITGWAAHLFYWVYPGVMMAMMAVLTTYVLGFFGYHVTPLGQVVLAAAYSFLVGFIAVHGISGSTPFSIAVNVIQIVLLVGFSLLAILFRFRNPLGAAEWTHPTALSVVVPHDLAAMLFQAAIAIVIMVGFESATSLAAAAKDPRRDIPRGVILSLVAQGVFAYLLQYFAANYALGERLTSVTTDGTAVTGLAAAAASRAPIGDLIQLIGNAMLAGNGFALMMIVAIIVALAVLGTALAAMNVAVRISFAMAQDNEMPGILGVLHGKYATPHYAVWTLAAVCAVFGAIGAQNVTALLGITLASNIGIFVLYALICGLTFVAYAGRRDFHAIRHGVIPLVGLIGNIGLLAVVAVIGLTRGGVVTQATTLALGIAVGWAVASAIYLVWNSRRQSRPILPRAAGPA